MKRKEFAEKVEAKGHKVVFGGENEKTFILKGKHGTGPMDAHILGYVAETDNTNHVWVLVKGMATHFGVSTTDRSLAQEIIEYGMTPFADRGGMPE